MRRALTALLAAMSLILGGAAYGAVLYVDNHTRPHAEPWVGHHHSIQEAMAAAAPGTEIWVAEGTYTGTVEMADGIALYGGFAGSEASLADRDPATHETVLDGDNAVTVVRIVNCPSRSTRVDGFTIRNGNSDSDLRGVPCGGGLFLSNSAPVIANNLIQGNRAQHGGGIGCTGSSPTITGNRIVGNTAYAGGPESPCPGWSWGGGISSDYANGPVTITGNEIIANHSPFQAGGVGIWGSSMATVAGNRIVENTGQGGLFLQWTPAYVANNLVARNENYGIANTGDYGTAYLARIHGNTVVSNTHDGIVLTYSGQTDDIANNIVAFNGSRGIVRESSAWGAVTLASNNVFGNGLSPADDFSGVQSSTSDISKDPLFLDRERRDYRLSLSPLSPCVDAGDSNFADSAYPDAAGNLRIIGPTVDMGAYESGTVPTNLPPVLDPVGSRTGLENQALVFSVTASDPDGDTLTLSASNLPPGALFDPATATFFWIPGYDQAGVYQDVEFTVVDDGSPIEVDTELITIAIGNTNRPPVVDPVGAIFVAEFETLTFTVTALDPDGDSITLSIEDIPPGASFSPASGTFTWTPSPDQPGTWTVGFVATDDGTPSLSGRTDVLITVADVPPVEQVGDLIDIIIADQLPTEVENSYLAQLKKVPIFVDEGKITAAINQVDAFVKKVIQDMAKGIVSQEAGDYYIVIAREIINDLMGQ